MSWASRFRLIFGVVVVCGLVVAATLVLNQRQSQTASTTASIKALSYSIGSDYAGTVVKQSVIVGDRVKAGDSLLTIQSAALANQLSTTKTSPHSAAYTVLPDGTLSLIATQSGVISDMMASVGGFVSAGQPLATIDRSGSLFVQAHFLVDPTDFARVERGASVDIVLPNYDRISGRVEGVVVHTVGSKADATIEVTSTSLALGAHDGLVAPGTPVTAVMHLKADGPFAGVKRAVRSLIVQIGL
jgi:multidrug resistance efflux pump